jgi:hypothetical protein
VELHNFSSSPNKIRMIKPKKMKWAGHLARMGAKMNAYRISVGRPKGKRPLGRPRRRLECNIKMNFRELGWGVMNWIHLFQGRDQQRLL